MKTSLRKMGNSTGMILPKAILDELGLVSGAKIDLRIVDGEVVAKPIKRNIREGWAEDAQIIGTAGLSTEDKDWLEFDDTMDGDWEW